MAVREAFLEEGIPKLSPDRETEVRDRRSEMCPRFVWKPGLREPGILGSLAPLSVALEQISSSCVPWQSVRNIESILNLYF